MATAREIRDEIEQLNRRTADARRLLACDTGDGETVVYASALRDRRDELIYRLATLSAGTINAGALR